MNTFLKSLARPALIAALLVVGALPAAHAQLAVAVATDSPATLLYRQQLATQIGQINTATASSAKDIGVLTTYLTGAGTGNGVVELLAAQGQQLSRLNSFNDQYWDNRQQQDKIQTLEAGRGNDLVDKYEGIKRLSDSNVKTTAACENVSMAMSSGGAHSNSRVRKAQVENAVETRMGANRPEMAALADLIKDRAQFCSADDVTNKRPGCSSIGTLPGADLASSSLTMGAINKANPTSATNRSFTPDQLKAALAYQNNVLPLPAIQPQGAAAETTAGKQALAQFNRYQARWSVINDALGDMIAQHTPMDSAPEGWGDNADAYARIFPGQSFPNQPSESEVLYFDAYQAYSDPQKKAEIAVMSDSDLAREQIRVAAIQARLQMQTVENQEKEIKLLSVLVTQQMDPVTAATVRAGVPAGGNGGNQ